MKEYNVKIADEVYSDIDDAVFYKENLGTYQTNIDAFLEAVRVEFRRLITSPKIGAKLSNRIPFETNMQYLLIDDYLLIYEIQADKDVNVYRLLPAKSNWQKILFG
ncbi:MAG: type II toxin-antitoxin system RelE/ParE family toxin [Defluviitaleaceae bacterium]|nr:type II toxin-antitoxin system RelE/ParE family toxin [Defluviitaleaceae bacterium]